MKSTEEQLTFIESMIANAKGDIGESSSYYLLWGYLAISAAIIQYFLLQFTTFSYPWITWPILMGIGGIASIFMGQRKSERKSTKTYVGDFMAFLWMGVVITLLLVLFMMGQIKPSAAYPIIILLYGLGTFVSGGILKFLPLKIGGIFCWIIGMLAIFVDFPNQILLIALALLLSYIIPGHLLSNYQKNV